jgi:hypothetical protein
MCLHIDWRSWFRVVGLRQISRSVECYNRADHRASVRIWDAETQARGRARALTFGVGPSLTSGAWYLAVQHKVRRELPGDLKE